MEDIKKSTILYCGFGWNSNIGNAFIDYGIKYIVNKTFPEYKLNCVSNTSSWLNYKYSSGKGYKWLPIKKKNLFDLRSYINANYYLFGGALFNKNWFKIHHNFINHIIKEKKSVLIIGGGGGNNYSKEEVEYVRSILKEIKIILLVTRDNETYENYHDLAVNSYNGIDCAFYLNDAFTPAKLNLGDYIVSTFDHRAEPIDLPKNKNIIRLYHSVWDLSRIELILRRPIHSLTLVYRNDLISDFPDDYLNIYANCQETYTDRVHACIAALIFGNKARYYKDSPRSLLFERVGIGSVKDTLVELDSNHIYEEKIKQLKYLNDLLL